MSNPNNVPTTEHVNLVLDESFRTLEMPLAELIKHLQGLLDKIPEYDRHTAKFEHEDGYYDDPDSYNICYTRTLTQGEIDEANDRVEARKKQAAIKTKNDEKKTRARERRELLRLAKKYGKIVS